MTRDNGNLTSPSLGLSYDDCGSLSEDDSTHVRRYYDCAASHGVPIGLHNLQLFSSNCRLADSSTFSSLNHNSSDKFSQRAQGGCELLESSDLVPYGTSSFFFTADEKDENVSQRSRPRTPTADQGEGETVDPALEFRGAPEFGYSGDGDEMDFDSVLRRYKLCNPDSSSDVSAFTCGSNDTTDCKTAVVARSPLSTSRTRICGRRMTNASGNIFLATFSDGATSISVATVAGSVAVVISSSTSSPSLTWRSFSVTNLSDEFFVSRPRRAVGLVANNENLSANSDAASIQSGEENQEELAPVDSEDIIPIIPILTDGKDPKNPYALSRPGPSKRQERASRDDLAYSLRSSQFTITSFET